MRSKREWITIVGLIAAAAVLSAQAPQTVAVRAGRLFDPKSGQMLANQMVLIQGERITDGWSRRQRLDSAGGKSGRS